MDTTNTLTPSWRDSLESIESLGSQDQGVTSLAGLHEARERHLGQFFTPLSVVAVMWEIAQQAFASDPGRYISLLDNSIGSARLLHYAKPDQFKIAGFDIHEDVIEAVKDTAEQAGFQTELYSCSMADARPRGFDVALGNPPFSIHLESPNLEAFECCSYGRFGPKTSAQSDEYALCQALRAAEVVVMVVPSSLAQVWRSRR